MAPIFDRRQLMALAAIAAGDLCRVASAQSTSSRAGTWPDERQIGSFLAHADFDLGKVERTLQQTGALRWDLERTLHVGPPREAINLFLFEREETFRAYVRLYFPDVPQRRALYIKNSRGPGMVFAHLHKEFAVDVRHECTHALLHAALPMVPLWLDEGIAEYFEAPADKRVYDNEHFGKLRWRAKVGSAKNIESLETVAELSKMGAAEYRYAWAWVHFMLHGDDAARSELIAFLADIAAQTPPGKLSRRLRRRLPNLDNRFLSHLATWRRSDS